MATYISHNGTSVASQCFSVCKREKLKVDMTRCAKKEKQSWIMTAFFLKKQSWITTAFFLLLFFFLEWYHKNLRIHYLPYLNHVYIMTRKKPSTLLFWFIRFKCLVWESVDISFHIITSIWLLVLAPIPRNWWHSPISAPFPVTLYSQIPFPLMEIPFSSNENKQIPFPMHLPVRSLLLGPWEVEADH